MAATNPVHWLDEPEKHADGYHRVRACYHADENIPIPTELAALHDVGPGDQAPEKDKKRKK